MDEALLSVADLAAGYQGHPVVRGVNLEVHAGEVVALLGANGAGKTTTLNALAGVNPALEGEVRFAGLSTKASPNRRAKFGMAYVTEKRSVFMSLTVRENLRVGRCDADAALEMFPELVPLLGRIGGQLSGGEQQILTLARALARETKLLLADELSLGLAPMVVSRVLSGVRKAADGGVGVLIVEQHVQQALKYADRVYVMRRGEIVGSGRPEDVAAGLADAYITSDNPAPERPSTGPQKPNGQA
jgi:ABC-type branched-subunit amino acid transport system ATPase component